MKSDYTTSWSTPTAISGAGTTASLTSATLNASGVLNSKLSCSGTTLRNANNVYGGVSRIALVLGMANTPSTSGSTTTYQTTAANIKAAPSNVVITQINAYSQRDSVEVSVPLAAGTTTLTMEANVTGVENTTPNGSSFNLDTTKLACDFSTSNSQCSTPLEFTFKKVHATASTRPLITLNLKSKEARVDVSPITAGNGASLFMNGWPSSAVTIGANNITGTSAQVRDMYNNNSSLSPAGVACTGSAVLTGFEDSVFAVGHASANSVTTPATTVGTGLYSITASIYKAATHNITIAACGLSRTETLTTTAGAFARSLITTSSTAPTSYNCLTQDLCEETLPTCTATNTSACGPFYVWKYDIGGNPLYANNTTPDDCGTNMNGITITDDGAASGGATPTVTNIITSTPRSFKVSGTAGKHAWGKIQCSVSNTITRGNRITFKAPTKVKPDFKCYPWGIDNTGSPEALCAVTNNTGYTISNINIKRCDATNATTDPRCSTSSNYSATDQDMSNYAISSRCYNLPSTEAGPSYAGNRCSVIITGTLDRFTPPFWAEAESPDANKVVFEDSAHVRVPTTYTNSDSVSSNTNLCTTGTTYHSSHAAGCTKTKATKTDNTTNVVGLFIDGQSLSCNYTYPTRRITVTFQANGDPGVFTVTPVSLTDTNDNTTLTTDQTFSDSCTSGSSTGINLGTNGFCKVKIDVTRPFNETVLKITQNDGTVHYVRTGESGRCTGSGKDL